MKEVYNCNKTSCSCKKDHIEKIADIQKESFQNIIQYNYNGNVLNVRYSIFDNHLSSDEMHDGEHPGGQLTVDILEVKDNLGKHVNISHELDQDITDYILNLSNKISSQQAEILIKNAGYNLSMHTGNIKIFKKGSNTVIISGELASKEYINSKVNK